MRNWIIISLLLIKAIFLQVNKYIFQLTNYELKDVRERIDSDNTNLSSIGFAESFLKTLSTLDACNSGLTRDKNAGPKTMEYLSFWLIYILLWCNLCIFWRNGNNLKTAHSKMVFWGSLQKTLTYSCFRLNG